MPSKLKEAFNQGELFIMVDRISVRGVRENVQKKECQQAKEIYDARRMHGISITVNPRSNPASLADAVAGYLIREGVETLVHLAGKESSRNKMQREVARGVL